MPIRGGAGPGGRGAVVRLTSGLSPTAVRASTETVYDVAGRETAERVAPGSPGPALDDLGAQPHDVPGDGGAAVREWRLPAQRAPSSLVTPVPTADGTPGACGTAHGESTVSR